jgi:DNA (cytosine-5)-methyltransferase 1
MQTNFMDKTAVIDMFCGIGGLTHGFVKEKFNVVAGIDIDNSCRYAFEKNNGAKFIKKDICEIRASELIDLYDDAEIRILVGCAPCQPFSKYTNSKTEDKKWSLLYKFGELIEDIKPEIISMENVPELAKFYKFPVYQDFMTLLETNGYDVTSYFVFCPDYGIPQTRTRLILFASRFGEINIIKKTHTPAKYKTVRDAISFLEPIGAGEVGRKDPLHKAAGLSELNAIRIRNTPEGGSWKDWDNKLVLECHKKATGKSYASIYGRMKWDDLSPTITTQCIGYGNGRFGHPEQDRAISLREAALLQSFPKYYDFIEPNTKVFIGTIAKHIGNAVPYRLGRVIARSIKKHIENVRLEEYYDSSIRT